MAGDKLLASLVSGSAIPVKKHGVSGFSSGNGGADLTISLATDAGWVDDGSGDFIWETNKLTFNPIRRNTTPQFIYLDLSAGGLLGGNLSATQWTIRLGLLTTTVFAGAGFGAPRLYPCISNNTDGSGTDQDTFAMELDYSSDFSGNNLTKATDSETLQETLPTAQNATFTTNNTSSYAYYIEFKKTAETGADNLTVSLFPTSSYETPTESLTLTVTIADLKYIKFINNTEQTQARLGGATLTSQIEIWNGSNP